MLIERHAKPRSNTMRNHDRLRCELAIDHRANMHRHGWRVFCYHRTAGIRAVAAKIKAGAEHKAVSLLAPDPQSQRRTTPVEKGQWGTGYRQYPDQYLYEQLGLIRLLDIPCIRQKFYVDRMGYSCTHDGLKIST